MTIVPVLKRELIALARSGGEHASRSFFAVVMLGSMLGTFTVWYHWAAEQATNDFMALVAERVFLNNYSFTWYCVSHSHESDGDVYRR